MRKDSQRKQTSDYAVFVHQAYWGFYTTLRGDTQDSGITQPVGSSEVLLLVGDCSQPAGIFTSPRIPSQDLVFYVFSE
jgi:hypothetical protein